jgi:hypothetical protein
MKGRIFNATMLVVVLVLVLAVPASAGKPGPSGPTVTVQKWTKPWWNPTWENQAWEFAAQRISWQNAPSTAYLVSAFYSCPTGTKPGTSCTLSLDTGGLIGPINISSRASGSGEQLDFVLTDPACGYTVFPAILMVSQLGESFAVLASALSRYTITCHTPH